MISEQLILLFFFGSLVVLAVVFSTLLARRSPDHPRKAKDSTRLKV
jgi:hypothetical protein